MKIRNFIVAFTTTTMSHFVVMILGFLLGATLEEVVHRYLVSHYQDFTFPPGQEGLLAAISLYTFIFIIVCITAGLANAIAELINP